MPTPEYKALSDMTDDELKYVVRVYGLREKIKKLDQLGCLKFHSVLADLLDNQSRIEALSSWLLIENLHNFLEFLLVHKIIFGLLVALVILFNIPPITTFLLAGSVWGVVGMAVIIFLMLAYLLGGTLQERLEKEFKLECKVEYISNKTRLQYNIHARNPGRKMYESLSYGESIYLLFSKYHIQQQTMHANLTDEHGHVLKSWNLEGDLIPNGPR